MAEEGSELDKRDLALSGLHIQNYHPGAEDKPDLVEEQNKHHGSQAVKDYWNSPCQCPNRGPYLEASTYYSSPFILLSMSSVCPSCLPFRSSVF